MLKRDINNIEKAGFTIVELLIVVVVIAILAAITIVSYNGITNKAADSVAQSNAASAFKKLAVYMVDGANSLPPSMTVLNSLGLIETGDIHYQYTVDTTLGTYCLTSTSKGRSYYVTESQSTPTNGTCPGHNANGIGSITNVALNPSIEVATPTFGGQNGATTAFSTAQTRSGARSLLITMPTIGAASTYGALMYRATDLPGNLKPNTHYTASAYVYVPTGTVRVVVSLQGAGRVSDAGSSDNYTATAAKNQWTRISRGFTTTTAGQVSFYILNYDATTTAGTQFWVDDIMVVEGDVPPLYADGNSPGWSWNGASGSSTSTGQPL